LRGCGIRQSGTGSEIGPGDKVRLEDRGGSPDSVCQSQIVEGDAGRARDKLRVDDRSSMCQEKRKMEGFM
jgi:hypothetical protein